MQITQSPDKAAFSHYRTEIARRKQLSVEVERDLAARYQRLQAQAPGGMLDKVSLEEWRIGRLVGTPEQLAEQVAGWAYLGVAELIVSAGPLPFSVSGLDDLELLASALRAAV